MAEVWGQMPKAQDDAQKINEAIDAAISAHNESEEAHLTVGQSLSSHKLDSVLDHPAGSVLVDKLTLTELSGYTIFESLTSWGIVGTVTNDDFPGAKCYVEYGAEDESSASTQPQVPVNFFNDQYDMLVQGLLRFNLSNTHFHAWFGILAGYSAIDDGFGFQVWDGVLNAHVGYHGTYDNFEIEGIDLSVDHVFRVQYNAVARSVSFYVDGVLVHSYVIGAGNYWLSDAGPTFGIKLTQSNDGNMYLGVLHFSRQITI